MGREGSRTIVGPGEAFEDDDLTLVRANDEELAWGR